MMFFFVFFFIVHTIISYSCVKEVIFANLVHVYSFGTTTDDSLKFQAGIAD